MQCVEYAEYWDCDKLWVFCRSTLVSNRFVIFNTFKDRLHKLKEKLLYRLFVCSIWYLLKWFNYTLHGIYTHKLLCNKAPVRLQSSFSIFIIKINDLKSKTYLVSHISLFIIPISAERVQPLFQYCVVQASQHHPGTIFRHINTNLLNLWLQLTSISRRCKKWRRKGWTELPHTTVVLQKRVKPKHSIGKMSLWATRNASPSIWTMSLVRKSV